MPQTFLMLNLYIVLKLQLITTKFSSLLAELFLVYWSVVSSKQINAKYTNCLYNSKSWKPSFGPIKVHLDFNTVMSTSTLVPSKKCWWGYGDGCSSISWAFMGGLTQGFLSPIYNIHAINYFEVQRRANRIKFDG